MHTCKNNFEKRVGIDHYYKKVKKQGVNHVLATIRAEYNKKYH